MFISGVRFDNVSMQQAVNRIMLFAQQRKPRVVCTGNLDHLRLANENSSFYEAYWDADLVVADGMPVLWLSSVQKESLKERVAGIDLFQRVCESAASAGLSVYLLGGLPGSAEKTKKLLQKNFPGSVVTTDCPTKEQLESTDGLEIIVSKIKEASPHILFVAFGAPLQETWLATMKDVLEVPVSIGVGGAFEMFCGAKARAPGWIQQLGMEWLFRLSQEPFRLFDRYLLRDLPFFAKALARALVGRKDRKLLETKSSFFA